MRMLLDCMNLFEPPTLPQVGRKSHHAVGSWVHRMEELVGTPLWYLLIDADSEVSEKAANLSSSCMFL
uniref:Putative ovule protein n=1 Tax=Solanum chacoense TaxID=4108 RepID=A0A0V0GZJ7_SOLCH